MERFTLRQLVKWKEKPNRKPLLLRGARQVGKTWLLKEFGKKHFKNYIYINFEDAPQLKDLFITDFDIPRILNVLEIYTNDKINSAETLIILDEIQAAERAITSLKYFQEKAPEYYVVAAGSLLGISMPDKSSFPVGKVNFLNLYPLSFSEFLTAVGEHRLIETLKRRDWLTLNAFKDKLTEYLKTYYYVGGMPEVVSNFIQNRDWDEVRNVQKSIIMTYESDFTKHAPNTTVPRIRMVWQNIPAQLAKENKKFMYGSLKTGGRARDFELAIQWLTDAGLLMKNCRVTKPEIPLTAFEELSVFKLFLVDVGLLAAMCNLPAHTIIHGNELFRQFKGALTEQFVMQQLQVLKIDKITYWTNERSTNEVDFIVQKDGQVIAIEVKAESNTRAKSFYFFCEKFNPNHALRLSLKNYKEESWMTNIPLYAVEYAL
ncbi:MAG: ATP-binding protein [Bacteroidota bacterium]